MSYKLPKRFQPILSTEDYNEIVRLAENVMATHGKLDRIEDGVMYAAFKGEDALAPYGLDNLVRYCIAESNRSKWPALIERHISILDSTIANDNPPPIKELDERLIVRIYPETYLHMVKHPHELVYRTDIKGTITVLALDLTDHFEILSKKDLTALHASVDTLFLHGIENLKKRPYQIEIQSSDHGDVFVIRSSEYAASLILCLMNLDPKVIGPYGSAVAIPGKSEAWIYPLHSEQDNAAILALRARAVDRMASIPGPVSDQVYRFFEGRFRMYRIRKKWFRDGYTISLPS